MHLKYLILDVWKSKNIFWLINILINGGSRKDLKKRESVVDT